MDKNVKYALTGLVGIIAVQQVVIGYQTKFIERQGKRNKKLVEVNDYLIDILIRNDTPIDKFDEIAIREIIG